MDNEALSTPASTIVTGNFDEFNSNLQVHALKATRNALALPPDVAFHRSIDSMFSQDLEEFSSRVLSLTNKLISLVATADTSNSSRGKGKGKLENHDDVVDNFHSLIVDSMDQLLERTVSIYCFAPRSIFSQLYRTSVLTNSSASRNRPRLQSIIQNKRLQRSASFCSATLPFSNSMASLLKTVMWIQLFNMPRIFKSHNYPSNERSKITKLPGTPRCRINTTHTYPWATTIVMLEPIPQRLP